MSTKRMLGTLALSFGVIPLAAISPFTQRGRIPNNNTLENTIYVDWTSVTRDENGSSVHPYTTVTRGYSTASDGDMIIIRVGTYPENLTFSKAVTVKSEGGTVRIGQSVLRVKLQRSLIIGPADNPDEDRDHDCLVDFLEGVLANAFRPYCIFDSDEGARQSYEPVTLFQVRPLDIQENNLRIKMKWVFLFRRDGGYGPNSDCFDDHEGDNDNAFYELASNDAGVTWALIRVNIGFKELLEWPTNSRLGVYDPIYPIIYMSAHKHHEYFTRDWDHQDSFYSDWNCNDDVNGQGAKVLVNLQSVASSFYNNVGEPEYHPSLPFVNDLSRYYPGHSVWGNEDFYKVGPIKDKWMTHQFDCNN